MNYVSENISGGWSFSVIFIKGGFRSKSYKTREDAEIEMIKYLLNRNV